MTGIEKLNYEKLQSDYNELKIQYDNLDTKYKKALLEKHLYYIMAKHVIDCINKAIELLYGKDYYNYGNDWYTCNSITILDILEKTKNKKVIKKFKTYLYNKSIEDNKNEKGE